MSARVVEDWIFRVAYLPFLALLAYSLWMYCQILFAVFYYLVVC
jgi:hypothetical protein